MACRMLAGLVDDCKSCCAAAPVAQPGQGKFRYGILEVCKHRLRCANDCSYTQYIWQLLRHVRSGFASKVHQLRCLHSTQHPSP